MNKSKKSLPDRLIVGYQPASNRGVNPKKPPRGGSAVQYTVLKSLKQQPAR